MNIVQSPSPNYDERQLPITLLVLHYTGMESGAAALKHMCTEQSKVCAHYMVSEEGAVHQLAAEKSRAWHAGVSSWNGESDINSASIGIEIVNGGHDYGLPNFPKAQIGVVISLCKSILARHDISTFNVLAHSDIAPERKQDPGEKFPWQQLAQNGIGYWPEVKTSDTRVLFENNSRDRGIAVLQSGLGFLGYGIEITGVLDARSQSVVSAFQRRYRPRKIDGQFDVQTIEILTHLVDVKKKKTRQ